MCVSKIYECIKAAKKNHCGSSKLSDAYQQFKQIEMAWWLVWYSYKHYTKRGAAARHNKDCGLHL